MLNSPAKNARHGLSGLLDLATNTIYIGFQFDYLPKPALLADPPPMNEVEIRTLIQNGVDLRLVAVPRPLDLPGFSVVINTGRLEQREMKTRRGQVRVFKKLETLWKLCKQLGIPEFEVRIR